ncbi:hypothetical protein [Bacillus sp. Brlt_9]|uniref:hypothetical protein n=1 Tax=Bacillus sp. Brlt_9 TaxID=3110916 RepID=UPI003F7C9655
MAITVLKEKGPYKFVDYGNGFFAVEYSNESVGQTLKYNDNKSVVEEVYNEVTA